MAVADVSGWQTGAPGKWTGLFTALAGRVHLADVVRPRVPKPQLRLIQARAFHPARRRWMERADLAPSLFRARTASVRSQLAAREAEFDAVVQLQTLCAPDPFAGTPYAIYTDNTLALTRRLWPAGAPLSRRAAAELHDLEAATGRAAAVVCTMSEFARQSFIGDYGCAPHRVVVAGGGCNVWLNELSERRAARPRALFVGLDFERKGGSVLRAAWREVHAALPTAELLIIGPRRAPDLEPGMRWQPRAPHATALREVYSGASVFVLPTLFEPFGLVLLEAMGCGLPCVATGVCAVPEIIEDGVTGVLVAPGDPAALAEALLSLLRDPDRARTMGAAAHRRVLERHTWAHVADRIAAQLELIPH